MSISPTGGTTGPTGFSASHTTSSEPQGAGGVFSMDKLKQTFVAQAVKSGQSPEDGIKAYKAFMNTFLQQMFQQIQQSAQSAQQAEEQARQVYNQ